MCQKDQQYFLEFDLHGQLSLTASIKKCPETHFMPAFTNTAKRKIANVMQWFLIMPLPPSKTLDLKCPKNSRVVLTYLEMH